MRCGNCNKFCGGEVTSDPSVDSIEAKFDEEALKAYADAPASFLALEFQVEVEKESTCCGETVATANLEFTHQVEDRDTLASLAAHLRVPSFDGFDDHELEVEEDASGYDADGGTVTIEWSITCCGLHLADGFVSEKVEEWEDVQ